MVRRWDQWKDPWDREYAKRGRLWRGRADPAPLPELVTSPARILEVGCGDGKFLAELESLGHRWIGLDASRRGIRLASDRLPAGAFLEGDARRLPFGDARFEVVVARYLLGALLEDGRRAAAAELVRVLAPDGLLLVEEFSRDDFRFGKGREVERDSFERNQGITTHYFDGGELGAAFAGLSLIRLEELQHELRIAGKGEQRAAIRMVLRKRG